MAIDRKPSATSWGVIALPVAKIKTADDSIRLFDDWCATNDQKLMDKLISYKNEMPAYY